jgi:FixJ family two-component response regulator
MKLEDPAAYDRQKAAAAAAVHRLAEDDRALLASLVSGRSNDKIAADLGVAAAFVEIRRARLFSELAVDNLNDALSMACAAGIRDFT